MSEQDPQNNSTDPRISGPPANLEDELFASYGAQMDAHDMSEEQVKAHLLALWQIMVAFVDLGFSVKAGDKFSKDSDVGMDDVLKYLCLEDIAPETVASSKSRNKKETR